MTDVNIYAFTDPRWVNLGAVYKAIWLDINDGADGPAKGHANSRVLEFTNNLVSFFSIDMLGAIRSAQIDTFKPQFKFSVTVNLNATLLTGRQTTTTNVPGLLATDLVTSVQPRADLPGNLSIAYGFVSAADTLKVAFTTPILYSGNTNIPLDVCITRFP